MLTSNIIRYILLDIKSYYCAHKGLMSFYIGTAGAKVYFLNLDIPPPGNIIRLTKLKKFLILYKL